MTFTEDEKAVIRYELNRSIDQLINRRIHADYTDPDDVPLLTQQIERRKELVTKFY